MPSPSDRLVRRSVLMAARDAKAAAVAAAASSIVPTWWFWCLVRVVRRVKVFWQSAYGHLYGRFPEWIRLCRARELESLKGYRNKC